VGSQVGKSGTSIRDYGRNGDRDGDAGLMRVIGT
jgi:hypothetical protein